MVSQTYSASKYSGQFFTSEISNPFEFKLLADGTDNAEDVDFVLDSQSPADAFEKNGGTYEPVRVNAVSDGKIIGYTYIRVGIRGDVSMDGKLSTSDISTMAKDINNSALKGKSNFDDFEKYLSDVDGNAKISVNDLSLAAKFINYKNMNKNGLSDEEIWDKLGVDV